MPTKKKQLSPIEGASFLDALVDAARREKAKKRKKKKLADDKVKQKKAEKFFWKTMEGK